MDSWNSAFLSRCPLPSPAISLTRFALPSWHARHVQANLELGGAGGGGGCARFLTPRRQLRRKRFHAAVISGKKRERTELDSPSESGEKVSCDLFYRWSPLQRLALRLLLLLLLLLLWLRLLIPQLQLFPMRLALRSD